MQVAKAKWWHVTAPQRVELVTELECSTDDPLWMLSVAYPASEWESVPNSSVALDIVTEESKKRFETLRDLGAKHV